MTINPVSVKKITIQDDLKYNGIVVLSYRIEYPEFSSMIFYEPVQNVNDFYKNKATEYEKRCNTELFNQAVDLYRTQLDIRTSIPKFEAILTYTITYLSGCIISLYSETYEFTGGAHGITVRDSQTWNLRNNGQMELKQLFGCSLDPKTYSLIKIREQIKLDTSLYFEDFASLIIKYFNPANFFCTYTDIVIYYQLYDIAPYVAGFREFNIPYNDCVLDPKMTCR